MLEPVSAHATAALRAWDSGHHSCMSAPQSPKLLVFAALIGLAASFYLGISLGRQSQPAARPMRPAATSEPAPLISSIPTPNHGNAFAYCLPCHRPDGLGIPGVFPPLVKSSRLLGEARIAAAIALHGLDSSKHPQEPRWGSRMVGLANLSDQELAEALTFARTSWGNQATAIDADLVTKVRNQIKTRTTPWTPAELTSTFTEVSP